ncbi:MAG: FG-GAP repeat protein, partial [Flavobacteriales bacterium]|nr:FG-GAP repeat protein [Flavobacteriales bacterium]
MEHFSRVNSSYGYLSGTSMACPLVSGLVALMLSKNSFLTPDEIETCLKNSCDNIDSQNSFYIGQMGAGRINAYQALMCVKPINADLTSDVQFVCPNGTVQFTDLSSNSPISWQWTFAGGSPATSSQQNPSIQYATSGFYDVTLIATNANGSDTLTKTNYIEVAIPTATISGNYTILQGYTASLQVALTGSPPWDFTYTDGTVNYSITGVTVSPYILAVSPSVATTYTLVSMNDTGCVGTVSGIATVNIYTPSAPDDTVCLALGGFQKISATQGGFTGSLSSGDWFGRSIDAMGDFNGDGVNDIIVGSRYDDDDDDGGTDQGAVWILYLNTDGTVNSYSKISETQGGFLGTLDPDDYFGISCSKIGDIDGDGIDDIAVGAIYDDDGGENHGAIWVIFLNANGSVKNFQKISDTQGGLVDAFDDNDWFGNSVSDIGDLDGDGVLDLAVGARADDDGGTDRGSVRIIFLNSDGTVKVVQKISDTQGGFTGVLDNGDWFGMSITNLGDLDGDGITDIAVGARADDDGGTNRGAVWVLFLNSNGTVKSYQKISSTSGDFSGTLNDGDRFGIEVENLGDMDQDGVTDILVGAFKDAANGTNAGSFWILYLNPDGTVKNEFEITQGQFGFSGVIDGGDFFGVSVANVGDLNGDGITEIAVGACKDDDGFSDAGAVWIIDLVDTCTNTLPLPPDDTVCLAIGGFQKISATQGGFTGSLGSEDWFARSIDAMGDFNGDGVNDIVVGSRHDDDGGTDQGAVWILYLNTDGTVNSYSKISETQGGFLGTLDPDDYFGTSCSKIGDIDGDGIDDIAVGAIYDDDGGVNHGAVWIIFLNPDGSVKNFQKISDTQGGLVDVFDDNDWFGNTVSDIGDFDGDGVFDIAVGSRADDDGGSNRGAIRIILLNSDGTVKSFQKISDTQGGFMGVLDNGDWFGMSITNLGDLDGDGITDIAVGARADDDGGTNRGAVWVLFLNSNGTVKSYQKISSTSGSFSGTLNDGDRFGIEVE